MRKTKVVGFSVPIQIEEEVSKHLENTGKTRSEFMRELITGYFESSIRNEADKSGTDFNGVSNHDMNRILNLYYEMIGMNDKDIIVIGLAIIEKDQKILIGRRKEKDTDVRDLSWVFPGGKMKSLDFRSDLKGIVFEETGINTEVYDIVHARLIPDSPGKDLRIIALYFHCKTTSVTESPGGDLDQLKWIDPTTVCRYFTTSTTDEVMNFLGRIGER